MQKNSQYSDSLIKFIETHLFFEKIEYVLKRYEYSFEIVNCCLDILAYLQDYGINYLA